MTKLEIAAKQLLIDIAVGNGTDKALAALHKALAEQAVAKESLATKKPVRNRDADRKRFPDEAFNRWLDEGISDAGHTIWDTVTDIDDAWAAWESRPYYAIPVHDAFAASGKPMRDAAPWHHPECEGECIACLIERAVKDAYGTQGLGYMLRHINAARPPAQEQVDIEKICDAIKAEDDYCVDHGDYMLDSDDCIKIIRGEWNRPDFDIAADRENGRG